MFVLNGVKLKLDAFQLCLIVFFVFEVTSFPVHKADNGQFIDISSRRNSDFNRLLSNNVPHSEYDELNDKQQNDELSDTNYDDNSSDDIETAEFRHRVGNRRRPCVPTYGKRARKQGRQQERQQYRQNLQSPQYRQNLQNQQYRDSARTLYDLNFYFVGYPPNGAQSGAQNNPDVETFATAAATNPGGSYNPYGGYDCSPNPLYQSGNYGSNFGSNFANGAYNDPSRPSTWGTVGQSLYEFFNGLLGITGPNADSAISAPSTALSDQQISNNVRPVFEINVPDTIQALVKTRRCTKHTHTHTQTFNQMSETRNIL